MRCKSCGHKFKKNNKICPNCENIFKEDNNYFKKNKFIPIILIFLLIGFISFGYFYINKPEVVFNFILKEAYKYANSDFDKYEQIKENVNLKFNIDTKEHNEVNDLVKDFDINSSINMDFINNKMLFEMGIDYKDKSLLKMDMYLEDKVAYLDFNDLFNKIIKVTEEDVKKEDKSNSLNLNISEEDIKKIFNSEFNALKESLKYADYKREKIKIDDNSINKSTIIINNENISNIINEYTNYLLNSNDYIKVYSKIENISEEEVIKEINKLKEDDTLKEEIYISIYTKILSNDFIKFEIKSKEITYISFEKISDKEYKMEINDNEGLNSISMIKDNGNNEYTVVSTSLYEENLVTCTMNITFEYNEKIQMPITKKVISSNEITEEDINYIAEKIIEKESIKEIFKTFESFLPEDVNNNLGGIIL